MVHSGIDLLLEVECFHKKQLQSPSGADEQLYSYFSRFEANSHATPCLSLSCRKAQLILPLKLPLGLMNMTIDFSPWLRQIQHFHYPSQSEFQAYISLRKPGPTATDSHLFTPDTMVSITAIACSTRLRILHHALLYQI